MASLAETKKRMPASTRKKLKALENEAARDERALEGYWVGLQRMESDARDLQGRALQCEADYRRTGSVQSKESMEEAKAEHKDKMEEIAEYRANKPKEHSTFDADGLAKWLRRNGTSSFVECVPDFSSTNRQTNPERLKRVRLKVDEQSNLVKRIESAPPTAEESIAHITAEINKVAAAAAPNFRDVSKRIRAPDGRYRIGDIRWAQTYNQDGRWFNDGFSLTVRQNRQALIDEAIAEIQKTPRSGALSAQERDVKLREAKARLLELERLEEVAFMRADTDDPSLRRRPIDFLALLQIAPADASEFG